jgi:hypothetical protein
MQLLLCQSGSRVDELLMTRGGIGIAICGARAVERVQSILEQLAIAADRRRQ